MLKSKEKERGQDYIHVDHNQFDDTLPIKNHIHQHYTAFLIGIMIAIFLKVKR